MSKKDKHTLKHDNINFYIIGYEVETLWGSLKPIKVKEYPNLISKLSVLSMEPWEVKATILKEIKNDESYSHIRKQINEKSFIECVQKNVYGLRDVYNDIFKCVFSEFNEKSMIFKIKDDEEFDKVRKKILEFNGIKVRKKSKNPEIEKFNKMKDLLKKSKNGDVDFDAMYTSLIAFCGLKPHDINDFSLIQFFNTFKRLELGKAYDTTTLFKTVDSKDKVEIINWYKSTSKSDEDDKNSFGSVDDLKNTGNVFTNR